MEGKRQYTLLLQLCLLTYEPSDVLLLYPISLLVAQGENKNQTIQKNNNSLF